MSIAEQMRMTLQKRNMGGGGKKTPAKKKPVKSQPKKKATAAPAKKWGTSNNKSSAPAKKWGNSNASSGGGGNVKSMVMDIKRMLDKQGQDDMWKLKAIKKILE